MDKKEKINSPSPLKIFGFGAILVFSFLFTTKTHAAVQFDNSKSFVVTPASSASWTQTISNTSTILLVWWYNDSETAGSSHLTSSDVGGIPLVQSVLNCGANPVGSGCVHLQYLVNPPTGSQTITLHFSSSDIALGWSATFTGSDTSSPFDFVGGNVCISCGVFSVTSTATLANDMLVIGMKNLSGNSVLNNSGLTSLISPNPGYSGDFGWYSNVSSTGSNTAAFDNQAIGHDTWANVLIKESVPAPVPVLSITYPPDASSLTQDFSAWNVRVENNTSSSYPVQLFVQWYTTSTILTPEKDYDIASRLVPASGTLNIVIPKNKVLGSYQTYHAQLVNSLDFRSSQNISFDTGLINSTYNTTYYPPQIPGFSNSTSSNTFYDKCQTLVDPTPTSVPAYAFTDTYTGINIPFLASTSPQFVLCHVVFPHNFTQAFLADSFNRTLNTPPLNYFFAFSSVIQNLNTSLATSSSQYEKLQFNQSTTIFGNTPITIMTSSSLDSFIGHAARVKWFEIYNALLNVVLGGFIAGLTWHRFKHKK